VFIALVCEECWKPQLPPYPVRVKRQEAVKLMEAVKISTCLCQVVNMAAGIVNCLYPVVPSKVVPDQLIGYLKSIQYIHEHGSEYGPLLREVESPSYAELNKLSDADAR
jgi:hypothetical protein